MSFDPFEARLAELQSDKDSSLKPKSVDPENDPFAQRLKQKEEVESSIWNGFYDMLFSPEETAFEQGLGQALRGVSTSVGGILGDTYQLAKTVNDKIYERSPDEVPMHKGIKNAKMEDTMFGALENLPTSESLMEKFDALTEGQYQPGSESEALVQEVAGEIGTFLLGAGSVKSAVKAFAAPILGNLVKEGMKDLEYGEGAQAAGKIGTMLLVSSFNPSGAKKYANNLYETAYANLPEGATIKSESFAVGLMQLEENLRKGLMNVESKKPVLDAIRDVKRNIKGDKVSVRDLTEAKRNLNELRAAKIYDPELKGGRKVRNDLKKNFGKLASEIDRGIKEYGNTNMDFFKPYKEANQAWGGIEQSKAASNFIMRQLKQHKGASFLTSGAALFHVPSTGLLIGGAGAGGLKSLELMHRVLKNPTLRKYYMNTLIEGAKQSTPGVINNLTKLDKEMKKEEKKR